MKTEIRADDLKAVGYKDGKALGTAIKIARKLIVSQEKEEVISLLKKAIEYPENCLDDELLAPLLLEIQKPEVDLVNLISLRENPDQYTIYGADNIEEGAINQMETAMKLPVTVAGSLMPDAHQGYGLPIGGVLATNNAVIPYGVGVDIGCRMALSVFDITESHFLENASKYKRELIAWTKFGAGVGWEKRYQTEHAVLERPEFGATPLLQRLKDKAVHQLGTSGGGNHFVEWGIMNFEKGDIETGVKAGRYLALLTHSGSRGLGATIAGHYTQLAKSICLLPHEAANLAYLDLDSEEGQEYWMAMNLAGDYASACHEVIHQRLTKAIGAEVLTRVENHHNFAWKEQWNNQDVIVHRKGATPAGKGVMGIIPGSMTANGYLVRGKGNETSINSASHGAGRVMSRTKAIQSLKREQLTQILKDHGVSLIGAGLDEAPMVYKNIEMVMAAQTDLVDVVATFIPKMVRMADDGSRED
jgi:tRNA-splicing ligase RtcB